MTNTNKTFTVNPWFFRAILISFDACNIQKSAKDTKEMYIQIFNVLGAYGYSKKQVIEMMKIRKEFLSKADWKQGGIPDYDRTELSEIFYEKFKKPYFAKLVQL